MKQGNNFLLVRIVIVCIFLGGCTQVKSDQMVEKTSTPVNITPANDLLSVPATTVVALDLPSTVTPSAISGIDDLINLPIDQFFEESFRLLMLRDPEGITWEGLAGRYGVGNDQLTEISDVYIRQTHSLQRQILDILRSYDRSSLTTSQQVSFDTYEWFLEDLVDGQEFMYMDYPVNPLSVFGVQYAIIGLFIDIQPLSNLEDARAYIKRLSQVKTKFDHVIEGLRLREKAGVIAPKIVLQASLGDIDAIGHTPAKYTSFYTNFQQKLAGISNLSQADQEILLKEAIQVIESSVLPAYQALSAEVSRLEKIAPTDFGVWQYAQGEAYYNYLIHHFTTTTLSVNQIHQAGLDELTRVQDEMRILFTQLGYPPDDSFVQLFARLMRDSGYYQGNAILQAYEASVRFAEENLNTAFDLRPQAKLMVKAQPNPGAAYYSAASLDGTRPGVFFATISGSEPKFKVPTLAYHEGIPGHHFQISIQREMVLPLFRNVVTFNAYAEGWALYAERLASELDWYQDDPYGNLGRLQSEAWRAARLVVDTGLHSKQWTFDQAVDFLVQNTGFDRTSMQYETVRYIAWPGQALSYDMGMLRLLEIRQKYHEKQGASFDLKTFHHLVLSSGSLPLDILQRIVLSK